MDDYASLIAADRVVYGDTRDRIGFPLRWARWMERIEHAMREETERIAKGEPDDLDSGATHDLVSRPRPSQRIPFARG